MADDEKSIADLYMKDARTMTDAELERVQGASDKELMRMSGTGHLVPVIEAFRRHREALLKEAVATTWLNWVLVALTVAILVLAAVEFHRH